jgi:diguanylate cyclase
MTTLSLNIAAAGNLSKRAERRRIYRRQMLAMIAGSYLLDAGILFAYYLAGTTAWLVSAAYATSGLAVCAVFLVLSEIGLAERSKDHYLTIWQIAAASAIQIGFLVVAPEVGFVFLTTLFIIFGFGALRLTVYQAAVAWSLAVVGLAVFLLEFDAVPAIPATTRLERIVLLVSIGLSVGRCVFLGLYGSALRETLHERGTQLKEAFRKIEQLAWFDDLTGTLNRRSLIKALEEEISRAERGDNALSVALVDLDWFKGINDRFGHLAGDGVLKRFPEIVRQVIRSSDKIGRYGGEEFLLILPNSTEPVALAAVNRICAAIAANSWVEISPGLSTTVSVGVTSYRSGDSVEQIIGRADSALYQAKLKGRNRALAA